MFHDLIEFPISSKKLSWKAKEVIKDIAKVPMLFQRVTLTGTLFPERALKPFVRIGESMAYLTEISEDGLMLNAYFDHPVADAKKIEFGYGDKVFLIFPKKIQQKGVTRLDLRLIPSDTQNVRRFRIDGR